MISAKRALLRIVAIYFGRVRNQPVGMSQHPACAQARYPDKPVRIVLPFAAGGVADITARIVAEKLGDRLGQRFYVENQPGAGGIAAARTVISSPPDGHTLALLSNGTAVSVSLFKKLPFDPLKDFQPISSLGFFDFIFATGADSEFKTLGDFIAAAKTKPGALNVGTINVGSTQNLSAELFKTAAGIDFTIVPYRATPEIQVSLLQNNIALMIDSYSAIKGNLADGKFRALASSGPVRSESTPDIADRAGKRRRRLRRRLLECAVCPCRHARADRDDAQRRVAGYPRRCRRQEAADRTWHRGQSEYAAGNFGPAQIRHREVADGDREGRNSKAIAAGQFMQFQKTQGWLDWYAGPSTPQFKLPAGAVDAHCHVFGPGAEFPYAAERKYTPCDASRQQLFALRDHLGFARNVVVQATCHGADNSAMVDALKHSGGKARGVATVRRGVSDTELQAMHEAGVRGVRFNFVKRLVDFTPKDELMEIAGAYRKTRLACRDLFRGGRSAELWDFFTALPTIDRRRSHGPARCRQAGRRAANSNCSSSS